jgi:hypothetical protein
MPFTDIIAYHVLMPLCPLSIIKWPHRNMLVNTLMSFIHIIVIIQSLLSFYYYHSSIANDDHLLFIISLFHLIQSK